uniref:HAT C-terminal dimerisation domain-containing protein n=1 Tax=Amphimedon queenslandica TaxID=400682 RepID=A0A1X7TTN4_AMPQE
MTLLTDELHQAILLDLLTRNDPNVVDLLEVCSFLDPRFKTKYINNKEKVKETVYRDGITMYDSTCASTSSQSTTYIIPPGKRNRTLGSLFQLHEDEMDLPTVLPEQIIKAEVLKYVDEIRLNIEDDPLKWWRVHRQQSLLLVAVAMKYLCVPATSTESERLFIQ